MNDVADFWIVHPFNGIFCLMLGFFALLLVLSALALRTNMSPLKSAPLCSTTGFICCPC